MCSGSNLTSPAVWGRWPIGWCGAAAIAARSTATPLEPRETWPASVGQGLDVQVFGIGGVARDQAVSWSRTLERSLCYSYGCWEVLEKKRPRPIDLVVGRSAGLGSACSRRCTARQRPWSSSSIITITPTRTTWPARPAPRRPRPTSTGGDRWPRSTCSTWSRPHWHGRPPPGSAGFPAEYRDRFLVLHDGVDTRRSGSGRRGMPRGAARGRSPGRLIPDSTRVVSFVARSLDRLRGFDRFLKLADCRAAARPDDPVVVVGDPVVRRGLDVAFHNRDYPRTCWQKRRRSIPSGSGSWAWRRLGRCRGPGRQRPARGPGPALSGGAIAARGDGRRLRGAGFRHRAASRGLAPWRKPVCWSTGVDAEALARQALAVLADPAAFRPLGDAAAALVQERYSQDACLPRLAETLACAGRLQREGGGERPVHPRRLPRSVRPARPGAGHAARLAVPLPGAEPLELPDADARDARGLELHQVPLAAEHRIGDGHSLAADLRALPRPVPDGPRRAHGPCRRSAPTWSSPTAAGAPPTLFLREVLDCPIIIYCEYYFATSHRDISYRIDLPPAEPAPFFPRCINAPTLAALVDCDAGYSATEWQKQSFPGEVPSQDRGPFRRDRHRALPPRPRTATDRRAVDPGRHEGGDVRLARAGVDPRLRPLHEGRRADRPACVPT